MAINGEQWIIMADNLVILFDFVICCYPLLFSQLIDWIAGFYPPLFSQLMSILCEYQPLSTNRWLTRISSSNPFVEQVHAWTEAQPYPATLSPRCHGAVFPLRQCADHSAALPGVHRSRETRGATTEEVAETFFEGCLGTKTFKKSAL